MRNKGIMIAAALLVLVAGVYFSGFLNDASTGGQKTPGAPMVNVTVPELSQVAKMGEAEFNASCASCHGQNAAGSSSGPPLIHRIYEPNHHGDFSFKRAIDLGVRAHHWKFGNMPAQPQVGDTQLAQIIFYVRSLQKANGIY